MKIEPGERIGLVGVNGAGKSTLLKIIAQEIPYDSGELYLENETKIGYLRQNSGLNLENTIEAEMRSVFSDLIEAEQELRALELKMGDSTAMDNPEEFEKTMNQYTMKSEWFMQHGGYEFEAQIQSILNGMGFADTSLETVIDRLSGGQKTRLALAKILLQEPNLLVLDEPTNHLDFVTLAWLEEYLQSYSGAILVVSHDRYFLDALVTVIYEIERTKATRYTGNYSKFVETKEKDHALQEKKYIAQQKEIEEMEDYVRRNIVRATSAKSAKNKRKQIERLERIEKPAEDLKRTNMSFSVNTPSHKEVLQVKDVEIDIEVEGHEQPLLTDINFQLYRGDKVALVSLPW